MLKKLVCVMIITAALATAAGADNLYRVTLTGPADAEALIAGDAEPVLQLRGACVVLLSGRAAERLEGIGIELSLIRSNISLDQLALDFRKGPMRSKDYPIVFEDGDLRLLDITGQRSALSDGSYDVLPIEGNQPKIEYTRPKVMYESFDLAEIVLDSLIGLVSLDSVQAYTEALQAFYRRVSGTDSIYHARDWLVDKYTSFGYDSVVFDTFDATQHGTGATVPGHNVIAYKIGTRYPDKYIVVGGHYDAVYTSPGADDNASGTVGALEIARVLAGLETEMTFVFMAFDSEETGLIGSRYYAENAAARGDDIIYMLNMDMIADFENDTFARLYYGPEIAYSQLWGRLADSLVNITGVLAGVASNSDHAYFAQNGYDVTFVHEYHFSSHYHSASDSTTYMDFDYMTRMIQASLATVYVVDNAPPPVNIVSVADVGDGQSMKVTWEPGDPAKIDHYWLYYTPIPATQPDSILVPFDSSAYVVEGLLEGQDYNFYLIAFDTDGHSSIAFDQVTGTPYSLPALPLGLNALPVQDSIFLEWRNNNFELDFHHFAVIRDDVLLPDSIYVTTYMDGDPALGTAVHEYAVVAVDDAGNMSDTTGILRKDMRIASLERNRILALNRSSNGTIADVNEMRTGEFMRDALDGAYFDYMSDTATSNPDRASLVDWLDYGTVIVGAESGRNIDDISTMMDNLLPDLSYYMSIGGKVIIFGRWGDITVSADDIDSIFYQPTAYNGGYYTTFNTAFRITPKTQIVAQGPALLSDFVGATAQVAGYPDLVWDSMATLDHSGTMYLSVTGIPYPSIPVPTGSGYEVIYHYQSRDGSGFSHDRPIAWRHIGGEQEYVLFDVPLSFFDRATAITALQKAITDLGVATPVTESDDIPALPDEFSLAQNYPNPFNPSTTVEFYNPKSRAVEATVEVFNILGQRVVSLFDGQAAPGVTRLVWDGRDTAGRSVASGIYFYRLKAGDVSQTRKMVLLK